MKNKNFKTVIALCSMADAPYGELLNVFSQHDLGRLNGHSIRKTTKKLPELKPYALRKILPLADADKITMLKTLSDGKMTVKEFQIEASMVTKLHKLQTTFVDITGCTSWEQAVGLYPKFTSRNSLLPYANISVNSLAEFRRFCKRAKDSVTVSNNAQEYLLGRNKSKGFLLQGHVFSLENNILRELARDVGGFDLTICDLPMVRKLV